jgi:multiple sugar transport system substrate-binding protein
MKKVYAILLVVTMLFAFVGCTGSEKTEPNSSPVESTQPEKANSVNADPVVLKFWSFHTGSEAEFIEQVVKLYNEKHDDIKIEHSVVNQSDYITTLIPTAYANGEAPDILYVEPSTFTKYAEKGMLADLTPYFSEELKNDILPSALNAVTYRGKIYALPFEMEILGLFYNADMLEEAGITPPTTWNDLYEAAKKLTTEDVYGLVLPVEKSGYTLFNWWPFMWMNGADVLSEDSTTCTVDTPEMAEALDFWGRFFKEGLSPNSLQIGPWDIGNIGTGIAAMQICGTYCISSIENNYPDVNIQVAPLPAPEGKQSYTVAGGQKLAVNAQSENIDAATGFIFWLYGDMNDTSLASQWLTEAKFAYPARKSIIDANKDIFQKGLRKTFTEFYDTAIPEPSYTAEITDALSDMLQNVMFGGMSGVDAAKAAHKTISEYLNQK